VHGHELQGRLPDLEPLTGLEHELGQPLAVEPGAIGAARIAAAHLTTLEKDLGVPTRCLRVVEHDIARLAPDRRRRRTDVAGLGRPIDVLDLENVVAAHRSSAGEGASLATQRCLRKPETGASIIRPRYRADLRAASFLPNGRGRCTSVA
jgi:hypothetical protein